MKINPIDGDDLIGKIVVLKKTARDFSSNNKFKIRYVLKENISENLVRLSCKDPINGNEITELWHRNWIEGWVTKEDAEKLLTWERLSYEN